MNRQSLWTNVVAGIGGTLALLTSSMAGAIPTVSSTADFDNLWVIADTSGNNQTAVSGNVYWDIFLDNGTLYFGFSIVNTTAIPGADTRITGFAWDAPTGVTMSGGASSLNWGFGFGNQTLPGEPDAFDACTWGKNNCGAGGNTGIEAGDGFNWFFVTLTTTLSASELEAAFADQRACLRVISIPTTGPGSGNGSGSDVACRGDGGDGGDGGDLPEPGTLALLGLGLLSLGLQRWRRV